jgi:hypothetical protein
MRYDALSCSQNTPSSDSILEPRQARAAGNMRKMKGHLFVITLIITAFAGVFMFLPAVLLTPVRVQVSHDHNDVAV